MLKKNEKYIYILNQKAFTKILKQKKTKCLNNYQFQKQSRHIRKNSLMTI